MSLFVSDYDVNSEEMNPSSNSSKNIFSFSKTNSTNISKTNSGNIIRINEPIILEEKESNNYFFEINTKNSFNIDYSKDYSDLENKLDKELQIDSNTELKITSSYLNLLFPKCSQDPFSISQNIVKMLYANQKKIIQKEIENQIDFFVKNNKNMKSNILTLNLTTIRIIGYILHISYNLFKSYNIDSMPKFKFAIDSIILNEVNIYKDYSDFCEERKKGQKDYSISKFISKSKNKYCLPCELIFLIKYLNIINRLDINFEELKLEKNDLLLFILVLMNVQTMFPKINFIKINLINIQFQNDIYSRFFRLEKDTLKKTNKYIKSFNYTINKNIFKKKWDFFNSFYVQEKNLLLNKLSQNNKDNSGLELNLMNENLHINELINKYSNLLTSILITFYILFDFININKLELIINDSYSYEYQFFFKKNLHPEAPFIFHILNFLKSKVCISSFNVELNILDNMLSRKIFYLIHKNTSLNDLQISFFSSDVTYFQQTIYKLYSEYINVKKENKIYFIEEPETEMLNYISKYFEKNLSLLFDIISLKKNLAKLGLYFEIPSILINNQRYMILILKFILNIIFLLDDENYKLNTLTLLSPYTILDKDTFPSIDDYLEELEIYEKNKILLNLNLRLKIYKIINIKNIISTNLVMLNIGDFDLISFEAIINYLISYKFAYNSNLKYLTIGLLKSIVDYNKKIHDLLNKLYSIKRKQLYELNIYTNLIIDNKEKYKDLINLLNYRWISSTTIVLNKLSTQIIEQYKDYINNINYLIPVFIDIIKSTDNKDNNNILKYYLYLKYIIFRKYKENNYKENLNDVSEKIIYGILKYLCCERKITICHNLINDSNI